MIKNSDNRNALYIGIASSLIVTWFIEPLLRICTRAMLWIGTNVYEGTSTAIYQSAALGLREHYSFTALFFMIAGFAGVLSGVTAVALFPKRAPKAQARGGSLKKIGIGVFASVAICQLLWFATLNFAELQLNASFNQRLAALSPYISDQEHKKFRSRWALMKTRDDYGQISKDMQVLAVSQSVNLPKALWE